MSRPSPKSGDVFRWRGIYVFVLSVDEADATCMMYQLSTMQSWPKKQSIPFPDGFEWLIPESKLEGQFNVR